jgi:hypothetical protein
MLEAGLISDVIVLLDIVSDAKWREGFGFLQVLTGVGLMITPTPVKFETSIERRGLRGTQAGTHAVWRTSMGVPRAL